jgi:site-specific recombinase XerD
VEVMKGKEIIEEGGTSLVSYHEKQQLRHAALERYLQSATSDNTKRAYAAVFRAYIRWGGFLPATKTEVLNYLLDHAEILNSRTLSLHLIALKQGHLEMGFADPTDSEQIKKALKGIKREHGQPKRKAKVFSEEDLDRLVMTFDDENLVDARNKALILVGYYGAFRRSELAGLTVDMLEWVPEGLVVTLRRSKTDQEGEGLQTGIPFVEKGHCPVTGLKNWLSLSGIEEGAVFRGINRWGSMAERALTPKSINYILKRTAHEAGLAYAEQLSGHSMRRSLVSHAFSKGASFEAVKKQGNWKSDSIVREYREAEGLFTNNVVDSLARKRLDG